MAALAAGLVGELGTQLLGEGINAMFSPEARERRQDRRARRRERRAERRGNFGEGLSTAINVVSDIDTGIPAFDNVMDQVNYVQDAVTNEDGGYAREELLSTGWGMATDTINNRLSASDPYAYNQGPYNTDQYTTADYNPPGYYDNAGADDDFANALDGGQRSIWGVGSFEDEQLSGHKRGWQEPTHSTSRGGLDFGNSSSTPRTADYNYNARSKTRGSSNRSTNRSANRGTTNTNKQGGMWGNMINRAKTAASSYKVPLTGSGYATGNAHNMPTMSVHNPEPIPLDGDVISGTVVHSLYPPAESVGRPITYVHDGIVTSVFAPRM